MAIRSEWPELGSALTNALREARARSPAIVDAIIASGGIEALRRWLTQNYLRGRRIGYIAQGTTFRFGRFISANVARAWVDESVRYADRWTTSLLTEVDERGAPTRMWLENRVRQSSEQGVWNGTDAGTNEVAVLAEAEFKVWVRAWPRDEHRDWHDQLADNIGGIPIDDPFILPGGPNAGSRVHGPRDWDAVSDPGEHLNCGHALRFEKRVTGEDLSAARANRGVLYDPQR